MYNWDTLSKILCTHHCSLGSYRPLGRHDHKSVATMWHDQVHLSFKLYRSITISCKNNILQAEGETSTSSWAMKKKSGSGRSFAHVVKNVSCYISRTAGSNDTKFWAGVHGTYIYASTYLTTPLTLHIPWYMESELTCNIIRGKDPAILACITWVRPYGADSIYFRPMWACPNLPGISTILFEHRELFKHTKDMFWVNVCAIAGDWSMTMTCRWY